MFWRLDCLNALWVNRGAAKAAGGFTEDAEIWVVGGGRVRDWVFGSGMRGTWIEGNVRFRISAMSLVHFPFIFLFVVELVAGMVGIWLSGSREGLRCGSGPLTTGIHRRRGGQGQLQAGWEGVHHVQHKRLRCRRPECA